MKTAKPGKKSPAPARNIDEYISRFPADVQARLQQMRAVISRSAPGAAEAMAYGIPTFTLNGNLVHFAGYEMHIGFYPTPGGIAAFSDELSQYVHAKGSVRFPLDKPLPVKLIRKIVAYRVAENSASGARKK